MSRPLHLADASDPAAVLAAVHAALDGSGPAVLPFASRPHHVPPVVPQAVAVVIETSGSTGLPKRVALSSNALLASAAASDTALGGPGQWLLALPAHYIAGVNVLVRSIAAGTDPVMLAPGHFDPVAFAHAASGMDQPRRYTSLVPAQLARLVERGADVAAEVARFDRILVGGQSTPASLLDRARELSWNVTRTYGASETSGGCVYDGRPLATIEARVVDGQLELAGPVLAEAYLDDAERTAIAFVTADERRWYRTGDAGEIVDGVVRVIGRLDDVIISGALKVSLGQVERLVRELPGQHGAVVIGAADARWGEVPVLVTTAPVDLAALRALIEPALGRAAVPSRVVVLDRIPLLASGKPDRRAIAASHH